MSHQHTFIKSDKENYEVCTDCGTYHSTAQINPVELYEGDYWDGKVHNTPDHQHINLLEEETCGISKADKVMQYVPRGQSVLEIGCFPGAILQKLTDAGYTEVYGIEPCEKYIDYILEKAQSSKIYKGYFPEATKEWADGIFDCIIVVDIFEHIDNHEPFVDEMYRILRRGGKVIIMSPIILEDGKYRERDFGVPGEHCWIFTKKFLDPYFKEKFYNVEWGIWVNGHEIIILTK